MTTMRQQTKAEFWQGHIQAAKSFHGSLRKYCDKENCPSFLLIGLLTQAFKG